MPSKSAGDRPAEEPDLVEVLGASRGVLKEAILPRLREAIIEGELAPGLQLSEAEMSRRLKVSRTPIREALSTLAAEGLVDIRPRIGTFVRLLRPDEIVGMYQVRMALEELAAREAAVVMSETARDGLRSTMAAMEKTVSSEGQREYAAHLDSFHRQILVGSGNESLLRAYESLSGTVRQIRRITLRRRGRLEISLEHHLGIGTAVVDGDGALAARLMREHLEDAVGVVQEVIEEQLRHRIGAGLRAF